MTLAYAPSRPAPLPKRPARRPVTNQHRLLQAKLKVGQVGDPLEREADAVAERVVQRKCAACGGNEEDDTVRLKATVGPHGSADAAVAGLGSGKPLPAAERSFFQRRLGRDFSSVRVHTESAGASAIGARAFTLNDMIAFAPGEWRPGTVEGRRLLAHELVHVVQQDRGAARAVRRQAPAAGPRTTCVGDVCFEETPGTPTAVGAEGTTMHGDVARREYVSSSTLSRARRRSRTS